MRGHDEVNYETTTTANLLLLIQDAVKGVKAMTPPGKQNPSASAQEIAETLYRETMADCRDVWSMSDETLKRIHGRMASAITAAVAAAEQEKKTKCPHCGAELLWSEDRGPHCDGCDDFDPETDLELKEPASDNVNAAWKELCSNFIKRADELTDGIEHCAHASDKDMLRLRACLLRDLAIILSASSSVLPATKATGEYSYLVQLRDYVKGNGETPPTLWEVEKSLDRRLKAWEQAKATGEDSEPC